MRIDFRTKLLLTIVIGILATEGSLGEKFYFAAPILALFPYFLASFDRNWSLVIKGLFFNALAFFYPKLLLIFQDNILIMFLGIYASIVIRILPGVMMAYYTLTTTKMSDLVYSLKKIKFPDTIIIPISVMFRFFYSIKEDYKKIAEAMYMQGLSFRNFFKDPMRILEYKFVPLLMITSQTADNVAISAMTRGMKLGKNRSSISDASFKIYDYILILFAIFLLALFVRVKIC